MVREVAPEEVRSRLEDGEDVTVVDTRAPEQFARGHVPGAINLPLPELPRRVDEREWDADSIVCVCPIGESSVQAARLLGSYEGIDADAVASMAGGYRAWDGELEAGTDNGESGTDEGPAAPF